VLKTLIYTAVKVSVILITFLIPLTAHAENHALLIGIGSYKHSTLEGPPHDVAALFDLLTSQYDFKTKNVHTLVNAEAVKSRILREFRLLTHRTRPGDRIFIYFSGHGTSHRDELMALPLPHSTGALVPADFPADLSRSPELLMSQLIIGKRDLRPTLTELDADRQILMVFDTCFSGNSVRTINSRPSTNPERYLALQPASIFEKEEQKIGSFESNLKPHEAYPYQNVFYISASTENEVAKDIPENNLRIYPTIDGKPHGVLTDALLRVLSGQKRVDTDNDGRWSQIELYTSVKAEVQRRFRQTPQALPKEGENAAGLHSKTFFTRSAGGIAAGPGTPMTPKPGLRIQVASAELEFFKARLSKVEGLTLVDSDPDLIVIKDRDDIVLALPNMHHLCRFTSLESHQVIDRIRRHLQIQPLLELAYPGQQFNVAIELLGPYQKSIVRENESFGFEISTDRTAFILLLNVDPAGAVHVLYPYDKSELIPLAAGRKKILAERCRALWPFGTENMKLFAFTRQPAELADLMGKEDLHPGSARYAKLEQLIGIHGRDSTRASNRMDAAQAMLTITSYAGGDIKDRK
jgi:hypothetical protein